MQFDYDFQRVYQNTVTGAIGARGSRGHRTLFDTNEANYVWLAPNGDDANSGLTQGLPVLTFKRATDILVSSGRPTVHIFRNGYSNPNSDGLIINETLIHQIRDGWNIQVEVSEYAEMIFTVPFATNPFYPMLNITGTPTVIANNIRVAGIRFSAVIEQSQRVDGFGLLAANIDDCIIEYCDFICVNNISATTRKTSWSNVYGGGTFPLNTEIRFCYFSSFIGPRYQPRPVTFETVNFHNNVFQHDKTNEQIWMLLNILADRGSKRFYFKQAGDSLFLDSEDGIFAPADNSFTPNDLPDGFMIRNHWKHFWIVIEDSDYLIVGNSTTKLFIVDKLGIGFPTVGSHSFSVEYILVRTPLNSMKIIQRAFTTACGGRWREKDHFPEPNEYQIDQIVIQSVTELSENRI